MRTFSNLLASSAFFAAPHGAGHDIPAGLKRERNDKGVTLSGGVSKSAPATASAKKSDQPKKPSRAETRAAAKLAKEQTPVVEQPAPVVTEGMGDGMVTEVTTPPRRRSIVPAKYKANYAKHNNTCGDDIALELKAATTKQDPDGRDVLDVETLWAIAKANELDVTKYVSLNNGQKRMNVSNKLRGLLKAGKDVVIGKRTFAAADLEV